MTFKEFQALDPREARRLALGALPADYRGTFAVSMEFARLQNDWLRSGYVTEEALERGTVDR